MPSGCHSVKVLSTTVACFLIAMVVAMETDLCMPFSFRIISEMQPEKFDFLIL